MQMFTRSKDSWSYKITLDTVLKYPVSKGSEVKCGDVRHYFLLPLAAFAHSEFPKLATFPPRSCRPMILSLKPIPPVREPQMSVPDVNQRRDSREHLLHSCSTAAPAHQCYRCCIDLIGPAELQTPGASSGLSLH